MTSADARRTAARYVRLARTEGPAQGAESLAWARCAAPESLPILRLEARTLQRAGDGHAADALIAQGLLLNPRDWAMLLLHAERLLDRDLPDRAAEIMNRVVHARPNHAGVRLIAARVALVLRQTRDAVEHLRHAWTLDRLDRPQIRSLLVESLLMEGDVRHARAVLDRWPDAPARLVARQLRAEGRPLEAADALERALAASNGADDALLVEWIDVLETLDDPSRLETALENIPATALQARHRAGASWLSRGAFDSALDAVAPWLNDPAPAAETLRVAIVACVFLNRPGEAMEHLERSNALRHAGDTSALAALWRRAALGRYVAMARSGRGTNVLPPPRPLVRLLEAACDAFAPIANQDPHAAYHLRLCQAAADAWRVPLAA